MRSCLKPDRTEKFMKIAIINAKYSPNLGDGALSECLEDQVAKRIPGSTVFSIDVAGSENYGGSNSMISADAQNKFAFMPEFMQKTLRYSLRPLLVHKRYFSRWRERLDGCDAIIIGGGHLLMDAQRYFPTRISIAVKAARKATPLFVYAVGVSQKFSSKGKKYFENAFRHGTLIAAAARDSKSVRNWDENFSSFAKATVALDPALMAFDTYGNNFKKDKKDHGDRPHALLGVSDPADMRAHADDPNALKASETSFFLQTAELLVREGFHVSFFTNGADQDYLDKVTADLSSLNASVRQYVDVMPRAMKPIELVHQLNQADVVIAHRLHANILSYSYKIPTVGLMWDEKVASFFKLTDRESYLIRGSDPHEVVAKTKEALSRGIDEIKHRLIILEASSALDTLAKKIEALRVTKIAQAI
jgi:polysaccharide pyruvyl transferase WcaK-like protein